MSRYIKQVVYRGEFEGDQVVVTMRPMTWAECLSIEDYYPDEPDSQETRAAKFHEVGRRIPEFLRGLEGEPVVLKLEGLFDVEGAPVPQDEFLSNSYFAPLRGRAYAEWFGARLPKDPVLPAGTSTGSSAGSPSRPKSPRNAPAASNSGPGGSSGSGVMPPAYPAVSALPGPMDGP